MSYLLYNLILLLFSPLLLLYLGQRYLSGKSKPGWAERWGRLPAALRWQSGDPPRIWIHAVSAGEVVAAVPILREIKARLPHHTLILSVITPAGHEMATQQALPIVDHLFYFPFDFPWVVARVVRTLRPVAYVSLESDLWPNLIHTLKRQGVPTIMVNGRLSEKSFRRTRRWVPWLFRWMLANMDRLGVQSAADGERLRTLGAKGDRIVVLGNSKFDQEIARLTAEEVLALKRSLHLPDLAPVFVAGSTRSSEEESQILAAYNVMRENCPDLCLVIAPRQIPRAEELLTAMQQAGMTPVRKTQLPAEGEVRHLILDTMGELANVYAVATIAFVGNSFPPVVKGGGQNLLQPLAHGKPVLVGPYIATIRSEVALASETGVGFQVEDGAALAERATALLADPAARQEIEQRALALIAANRGASARYAQLVAEALRG